MAEWLKENPLLTFLIIYVCLAYVYVKVFRMRRLPLLKELIIFLLLGAGSFILLLFQLDLRLPIVNSLLFAIGLMLVVRIRMLFVKRSEESNGKA